MPYYVVPIEGDAARARGLLAVRGIQNLAGEPAAARIRADDAESAVERVRDALGDAFTVGEAREEGGD
jgi:hypothetical protein